MSNLKAMAEGYVGQLRRGDAENAWFSLVECGPAMMPYLVDAFRAESDARLRAKLVTVIAEYRCREAGPFFAEAIADVEPEVWKAVLDGLVKLGGEVALEVLKGASANTSGEKGQWLDEAIEQLAGEPGF